ncbi:hypothetical protein [Streptomyces sp. NPDC048282]|uniref:hypothetical protein n=1 Tax=Streptomyces sp. NPDC048282 TaxID=3365528 RepID=UPI00371099D3
MSSSFFKSLTYADVWANHVPDALDVLHAAYGFAAAGEDDISAFVEFGTDVAIIEVDDGERSTALQVTGPARVPGLNRARPDYPFLVESAGEPPLRPAISHATVVATPDLDALVEHLRSRGARYRFDQPYGDVLLPRLWPGWGSDKADPFYSPEVDAGMKLEFWEAASSDAAPQPPTVSGTEGGVTGIEAVTFLVADPAPAVALLEKVFDWVPDRSWTREGTTVAEFAFTDPKSARIQLVSPQDPDGRVGRHLTEWREGPYLRRFTCADLGAREEELRRYDIGVERGTALDGSGRDALLVQGGYAFSGVFEFVQDQV